MDEKLMVMEQDRLAKEKKRKKSRKKIRTIGAVVLIAIVVVVGIWYVGWGRHMGDDRESTVQIVASAGQKIVYADLTDVKGNEITYRVAQELQETTNEPVTTLIPVGTDVTTKLGTVTTFSGLAAGDRVALVVEEQGGEQIIIAVYIIE